MSNQNHSQFKVKLQSMHILARTFVIATLLFVGGFLAVPSAHASSATSTATSSAVLSVTGISAVQSAALADNTYTDGWKWVFNVTVPQSETILKMKFADWSGVLSNIPAGSNIRFYSLQSSNVFDESHAISIGTSSVYSDTMYLLPNSDLDATTTGRQIQIIVEVKIPTGSSDGAYSSTYGILTNQNVVPPVITGTSADISAQATSSAGAAVSFATPTATDLVDGTTTVSCIPPSGSIFPIGTTNVVCSATDTGNVTATSSFNINILANSTTTNSSLASLIVSAGTLSPIFSSTTLSYTDSVANATDTIIVTPTATNASSTVTINGFLISNGSSSSPIVLSVGTTTITTIVTAQNGINNSTYVIDILRAATSTGTSTGGTGGGTGTTTATTTYNISVSYQTGGTATGGGVFNVGATVTAIAVPDAGYIFNNWTGGPQVSTSTTYTFIADQNRTLVASFTLATTTGGGGTGTTSTSTTYSMVASPTSATSGSSITLTWSAPTSRNTHPLDWVGLYLVGDANISYGAWKYTSSTSTGTFITNAPVIAGTYEFRYLLDNGYISAATSNPITVTASSTGGTGGTGGGIGGTVGGTGTTTATTTLSGGSCAPTDTSWNIISTTTPTSVIFWAIGINNVGSLPNASSGPTWLGSYNY